MRRFKELALLAIILLPVSLLLTGCGTLSYGTSGPFTNYESPQWGPDYYNGARYYYLPDIESYYDLSSHEFAYLDNGQWAYSQNLPPMYSDYDLNDGYVVVLDANVYQPWLHHQYYVSHYPRYYYVDYYDHSNIPYVRGFNENIQGAIYWKENQRNRARSWDNQNPNNIRKFSYTKADRQQQKNFNNQTINRQAPNKNNTNRSIPNNTINNTNPTRNSGNNTINNPNAIRNPGLSTVIRRPQNNNNQGTNTTPPPVINKTPPPVNNTAPPVNNNTTRQQPAKVSNATKNQPTNYYGRTIGKPVRVTNQMRNQRANKTQDKRR